MAVTRTPWGYWNSSLAGWDFETEADAKRAENNAIKRSNALLSSPEQKLLDSLTAEQYGKVAALIVGKADAEQNRQHYQEEVEEWCENNPHLTKHDQGGRNTTAMALWLNQRGKVYPFSYEDMDIAAEALSEMGTLAIDRALIPKK